LPAANGQFFTSPHDEEEFDLMSDVHYLTADGLEKLQAELIELKGPRRLELSARLRAAIQMGDLSENADYIQAKEEQGFLEGRILELDTILRNVKIIDEKPHHRDVVDIGAHVTIQEDDFPEETYHVVGPKEANPTSGRISHESPIGRALLGRRVGDLVVIEIPAGELRVKITKIE
jgi:transcription elongation factor GreA